MRAQAMKWGVFLLINLHYMTYIKEAFTVKELLYYQDAMLRDFDATIARTGTEEDGRQYVVLSNTAFILQVVVNHMILAP